MTEFKPVGKGCIVRNLPAKFFHLAFRQTTFRVLHQLTVICQSLPEDASLLEVPGFVGQTAFNV